MLHFVNAHRLASVSVLAAAILVVVTLSGLVGGGTNDSSPEGSDENPPPSATADLVPASSPISATTPSRAAQPTNTAEQTVATDRMTMPVDPSGSRGDRSSDGARQAAVDFAGTAQQRLMYLTDDAARELLTSWFVKADDRAALDHDIDELATLRSTLLAGGGEVWWSVTPIAWKVEAFDDDRARVAVWVSQVVGSNVDSTIGGEAVAPTVDFRTTTVDLMWDDSAGWSVWHVASAPGPIPMMAVTSTMSAPTEFMDVLGTFTLLKEHS